jgi:hypothetical protein
VERGDFSDSTNRFVIVAGKTLKAHGVKAPAGYDEALTPWLKRNWEPSADECKAMAKALRGMK